jgi:hypothetical protein
MGAVALARGERDRRVLEGAVEPENAAELLGIAQALAREIAFENDNDFDYRYSKETPEERWTRMREWVVGQILPVPEPTPPPPALSPADREVGR